MSNSKDQLKRAYKLIKRDKSDEARAIIRPILDAEPDNAEAWWLLAHTVDDPIEVRAALNKMLALDPRNSNAPKARELLAMLDQQFPSPGIFEDEGDAFPATEAPTANVFSSDFGSDFPSDDFEALGEEMFPSSEKPEPAGAAFNIPKSRPEQEFDISKLFEFDEVPELDDEAKAALEEKVGRRASGRGRRLLRVVLLLVLIPLIAVVVLYLLLSDGGSKKKDPGTLASVQVQSDKVGQAVSAAEGELSGTNLGSEQRVVVAQGSLGNTLFVEFCSQPAPDMPELIAQGMAIAVRQAPAVAEDLAAVGVSVNLCSSTPHDTLYRASAPVNDAVRFLNGEFGEGENGLAGFQATWKTS